jgi:hypothetical protein
MEDTTKTVVREELEGNERITMRPQVQGERYTNRGHHYGRECQGMIGRKGFNIMLRVLMLVPDLFDHREYSSDLSLASELLVETTHNTRR